MHHSEFVSFSKPVVGPKVYLAQGPSGLAETFNRAHADHELEMFLGSITMKIAIESFLRKMAIERRAEKWLDVLEHLAKLANLEDTEAIPIDVGIAFWARTDLEREAIRIAKQNAKRAAQHN